MTQMEDDEKKRERLLAALSKEDSKSEYDLGDLGFFNPWEDIIQTVYGSYSRQSDDVFIKTLEAIRDRATLPLIQSGFEYELAIYVLAGHGYVNYGGSPISGWPDSWCADLWDKIIEKWKKYYKIAWNKEYTA